MSGETIRIEVDFGIAVVLTSEQQQRLHALLLEICDANCPEGSVFWPAGYGSKPRFSKADALFLGKSADPDAPARGEPTFDDSVYYVECCCREASPAELETIAKRKGTRP